MKLKDKVAVITGGSSGIGLATAQRFVAEGAHVYILGRRQAELDKARAAIGSHVSIVRGDVANMADLDSLYRTIASDQRRVDVVVACAGIVGQVPLAHTTPEHLDEMFKVNIHGVVFTVQKALPLLNDGASIILVSSTIRDKGVPANGAYSAAKAAVRALARTWAAELKDRGIRVNTLSPGAIDTPMLNSQFASAAEAAGAKQMFAQMVPLGRVGRPEEMAAAALFLASSESSYSTGMDLVADGGITQL